MSDFAQYKQIDGSKYRRIFVVGDVHGCLQQLNRALSAQHFQKHEDLLVSVGDLIDRGEHSISCLSLIEQHWFASVRGNHEQMAIDALKGLNVPRWLKNGGDWFYKLDSAKESIARELIALADTLPHIIEIQSNNGLMVIAHADYPLNRYEYGQPVDANEVVWSRQRIADSNAGHVKPITGAESFFFGHTPVENLQQFANQYYIDTGVVFGGRLTLLQIQ
jgi:serine/threonine protein phosphatase 1